MMYLWLVGYCVSILGLFCSGGYDCGCPVSVLIFVKLRKPCCHYKLLETRLWLTILSIQLADFTPTTVSATVTVTVTVTVTKTDLKMFILKHMIYLWLVDYCVSILGMFCSGGYDCGYPVSVLVIVKIEKILLPL